MKKVKNILIKLGVLNNLLDGCCCCKAVFNEKPNSAIHRRVTSDGQNIIYNERKIKMYLEYLGNDFGTSPFVTYWVKRPIQCHQDVF